ncbi:MAG: hypothetical protein WAV45_14660 [Propionibacteriaceae bacterium]|nr:carboxypeptidase regulatory-like domain-containing protein [Micropruina sp.]HBX79980.1 hypothetical protein [Propionibacteriaceae bacterium]
MNDDLLDGVDAAILDDVRGMWDDLDPVPAGLEERIRFALNIAAMEAELAELMTMSLAGVRGTDETDTVTFTVGSFSLMITTLTMTRGVRIDGWVTGDQATVDVVAEGTTLTARPDTTGRFSVADVPRGRTHFVVHRPGHRPVITPSIDL